MIEISTSVSIRLPDDMADSLKSLSEAIDRSKAYIIKRVIKEMEEALSCDPDCGKTLTGQFKGLFKLGIGEYPVIYSEKQG